MVHMFQNQLHNPVQKASTITRVDLRFAVNKLAKFSANPGKVHFEGLVHLLRYIRDNKNLVLKYHSISVDQARYATSIVAKYLDNSTVKVSNKFYKTTLPSDMIFTK